MKKYIFILIMICLCTCCLTSADSLKLDIIDITHVSDGYFIVNYDNINKIKICIEFNGEKKYYDYTPQVGIEYPLLNGNGEYTIIVYENIADNRYKAIRKKQFFVELENEFSPFLISTYEVQFDKDDDLCKIANALYQYDENDLDKVNKIYDYVFNNVKYDYDLANDIINKYITHYQPKPEDVLKNGKGICLDYAVLYAAMCRSQNIPCYIEKGYVKGVYHAWNMVYIDDQWIKVDTTIKRIK